MSAIIYKFKRSDESGPADETERLLAALGRYSAAELLELLYVGEEPGFFELMRGLFGLPDEARLILQNFLATVPTHTIAAEADGEGSCVLKLRASERVNPIKGIAH